MTNAQATQIEDFGRENHRTADRREAACIICQQPKEGYITIFGKPICNECQQSFSQDDMEDYRRKVRIIRELIVCK